MTGNMTFFKFGKNHAKVLVFVGCMMMTKCFLLSCGPVSEIFRAFRLGHHKTLLNTKFFSDDHQGYQHNLLSIGSLLFYPRSY